MRMIQIRATKIYIYIYITFENSIENQTTPAHKTTMCIEIGPTK